MTRTLLLLTVFFCAVSSWAQPVLPSRRGFDTESIGIDQKLGSMVPLDTVWEDENGKKVRLGDFFNRGNAIILVPIFYRCTGSCMLVLEGMLQSLNAFKQDPAGRGFEVVVFSINPTETMQDAKVRREQVTSVYRYPEAGKKHWHFLRGDLNAITELTAAIGFRFTFEPEINRINHAAGVMVISPTGRINEYFYGTEYPGVMMLAAIRRAEAEQVAEPARPVLFGCFMYDPLTGRYRPVVQRILQVGGITTLLVLATSILVMSRRSRPKSRLQQGGSGGS